MVRLGVMMVVVELGAPKTSSLSLSWSDVVRWGGRGWLMKFPSFCLFSNRKSSKHRAGMRRQPFFVCKIWIQ